MFLLLLLIGGTCHYFLGEAVDILRRRGGNRLENLAKHLARRLVLFYFSSRKEDGSTILSRGGNAKESTIQYNAGLEAANIQT
jgi:hypothetical protein